MSSFIAIEMVIALCVAPCVLCWVLGEMHGAARTRALLTSIEGIAEQTEPSCRASIPEGARHISPDRLENSASASNSGPPPEKGIAGPVKSPARPLPAQPLRIEEEIEMRGRRATFHDMPSLADLHRQTATIRNSARLWDDSEAFEHARTCDPISERVLRHYTGSINALAVKSSAHSGVAAD